MHPYFSHRNYLSPSLPYARAHQKRAAAGGSGLRRMLRAAVRQWKRRRMIAALQSMDDRLLRDIGVYRSDIQSLVAEFDDRELGLNPVAPGNDRSKDAQTKYLQAA
ncbi:DUF1127 domain-containing protein [Leisingera sp. F5]|uniref:DUF1127 domain-containing protein n=1 Tax=Leisingera sp. F5 TaxID=1813816 RepID=UPI000A514AB8|nr:DUF1127 domain-containing protein [Leisingera sp. F5]